MGVVGNGLQRSELRDDNEYGAVYGTRGSAIAGNGNGEGHVGSRPNEDVFFDDHSAAGNRGKRGAWNGERTGGVDAEFYSNHLKRHPK